MAGKSTVSKKSRAKRVVGAAVNKTDGAQHILKVPPAQVSRHFQGFTDFIRTQGVVGLAVGLILGVSAKGLVDSIVANVFTPIISSIGAGDNLDGRFICIKHSDKIVNDQTVNACVQRIGYGSVISQLISFITVAALVYFVFKMLHLDKLEKPKE